VTNLCQLTTHSIGHHVVQHGDRIVTIDCSDVTSPYVYQSSVHLDGDFIRPERIAEVDDQVQPSLSVLLAEYRHADLLLGRRVRTASRRTAGRRAGMRRPALRVRRTVDSLQTRTTS